MQNDILVSLALDTLPERAAQLAARGCAIFAIDALKPDVGHEVLWVVRDTLSGQVLCARSLLSSARAELQCLLDDVRVALPVPVPLPVVAVVSDGQHSIRQAVAAALPGVPHQLCQFHYLKEAARPLCEADRHAKKELKKLVRGVCPLERVAEQRPGLTGEVALGYCAAVRSALTDDARAVGLWWLTLARTALRHPCQRAACRAKRESPTEVKCLADMLGRALDRTSGLWSQVAQGAAWVQGASAILRNDAGLAVDALLARDRDWSAQMDSAAKRPDLPDTLRKALSHFVKVSDSYGGDLFHCCRIAELPHQNNALEQAFGSLRYHERRASGRFAFAGAQWQFAHA